MGGVTFIARASLMWRRGDLMVAVAGAITDDRRSAVAAGRYHCS